MAENSTTNPQVSDNHSPLSTLAMQAIRRFGDFAPGTIDGDVMLMFIEFANQVVDDVRSHPYHDGNPINYYQSQDDIRAIPDNVVVAGLLFQYAMQQGSEKIQLYQPSYYNVLNSQLWYNLNGNSKIQMRVMDGGTHANNSAGLVTDPINGTTRRG